MHVIIQQVFQGKEDLTSPRADSILSAPSHKTPYKQLTLKANNTTSSYV